MSICKQDIKQGVLDKVLDELDSRYTYSKISQDTIRINSVKDNAKSKVTSKGDARFQAKQIANSVLKSIYNSYNGYVTGYINDVSRYDPITVTFTVKDEYINHLYNNVPTEQKQYNMSPVGDEELDRDFVNSDSDWNSFNDLDALPTDEEEPKGVFQKFIEHKERLLNNYKTRLTRIEGAKKEGGITKEKLDKLNSLEREVKMAISGSFELGKKGLEQEIEEIKKGVVRSAIGYYAERDLQKLDKLAFSNSVDDIKEAHSLVDFYKAAGTFRLGQENPFFSQEEIFLKDDNNNITAEYRVSEDTRKAFEDWAKRAVGYNNIIDKKEQEILEEAVNSDYSVINTYGNKKFDYEDLVNKREGLKDTHWADMWVMDITNGTFSTNGILPQVIFSKIANGTETRRAWSRDIATRVEEIQHELTKELSKPELKQKLKDLGIEGIEGISYNMFQERTKEGLDTHTLISRYEKQFNDDSSIKYSEFYNDFNTALQEEDDVARGMKVNRAFDKLKGWKLNNTMIMDISKLPEIANDSNFSEFNAVGDEEYSNKLKDILGTKGYNEEVQKQKDLLTKYQSEREAFRQTLLIQENKDLDGDLSDESKSKMSYWENNHNPLKGIEDYYSVKGLSFGNNRSNNFMTYNNLIPRKYKVTVKGNLNTDKYEISDTKELTGHYSKAFEVIENNPVLSKFHDIAKEVCDTIRKSVPYEVQEKMPVNTLPGLRKTSAEILADKNIGILKSVIPAFKSLWEKFRLGFGIVKQSDISYAKLEVGKDGTKTNYKVNSGFLENNNRSIQQRRFIETTGFLQAFNANTKDKIDVITKNTVIPLKRFNTAALIDLAKFINVDILLDDIKNGKIDKIKNKVGDRVEIGRLIKDYSVHSVVQSQSFDLPKLLKYFSDMTMVYAAKEEALPLLEILKKHYEGIKKPETNNLGNSVQNVNSGLIHKDGLRTNAIKQFDDWFNRVALDNYGKEHFGPSKRNIYSNEEKQKIKDIDELIKNETNEDKIKQLQKIKDNLGRVVTTTAIIDNLLNYIRFWRLGYNLSSATTNLLDGLTSNMMLGANNESFEPNELFYGYSLIKQSFVKNATFGLWEPGESRKLRKLMDKFNVLMDSKNELQKSSRQTRSDRLSWLSAYQLNSRVEYINQSPLMVAMLRTLKLEGKDGTKEMVWKAFDKDGKLTDNFRTEENIKNWEELNGEQYLNFKQKLHANIVLGHGNYDEMRGMMAKSGSVGKMGMMFKTWLPNAINWRFAKEQGNIQLGQQDFKGIYRSHTKGSGIVHGALAGSIFFGPIGAVVGAGVGGILANKFGVDTGIGIIRETILSARQLFLTALGIPVNLITRRELIKTNRTFDKWIGKGNFTERDARNLKSTMADLAMQLGWLGFLLMTKALFWDDNDKPDDPERIAHNILVNKLMSMSSQASSYTSIPALYKNTIGSMGMVSFLTDAGKLMDRTERYVEGRDIIASGSNRGQSGLGLQMKKMLLPGIFKDVFQPNPLLLGLGSEASHQFNPSPFDQFFKSPEKIDAESNKALRASRKNDLLKSPEVLEIEDDKDREKYIKSILDDELPTPTRLKKLDETREEYEKDRDSTSNQ